MVGEIEIGPVGVQDQGAVAPVERCGPVREGHVRALRTGMGGDEPDGGRGGAQQALVDAGGDERRVLSDGHGVGIEREGRRRGGLFRALPRTFLRPCRRAAAAVLRPVGVALARARAARRGTSLLRRCGIGRRDGARRQRRAAGPGFGMDDLRRGARTGSAPRLRALEDRQPRRLRDGAEQDLDDRRLGGEVGGRFRPLLEGDLGRAVRPHDRDDARIRDREQDAGRVVAVVDVEAAGMAVGLGHYREGGCAVVGLDGDVDGGAADAHGRDRGRDLHVARLGDLARHEGDRPLDQAEQGRVARAVRLIDEVVDQHPRGCGEVEQRSVEEGHRQRGAAPRLKDVALVDEVAHMQRDADAVAHGGRRAGHRLDAADGGGSIGGRRGAGLGVDLARPRPRQAGDHRIRERGAVRRDEPRPVVEREVVMDDERLPVAGNDEVVAVAGEIPLEQQRVVADLDGAARPRLDLAQRRGPEPEGRCLRSRDDVSEAVHGASADAVPALLKARVTTLRRLGDESRRFRDFRLGELRGRVGAPAHAHAASADAAGPGVAPGAPKIACHGCRPRAPCRERSRARVSAENPHFFKCVESTIGHSTTFLRRRPAPILPGIAELR